MLEPGKLGEVYLGEMFVKLIFMALMFMTGNGTWDVLQLLCFNCVVYNSPGNICYSLLEIDVLNSLTFHSLILLIPISQAEVCLGMWKCYLN